MGNNKDITKRQHYVPQVYLRSFSKDKKHIWSCTIDPLKKGKCVPIESVCSEKYLYEVKDEAGNLIAPNWIEKNLSGVEGLFASNLKKIESKAFLKENYKTKCFLTTQEKTFWKLFVAIQMMRNPVVLDEANDVIKEVSQLMLTDSQIRAIAVSQCLPFFSELKPEDNNVFFVF